MTTDNDYEPFVDAVAAADFLHLRPRRVLEMARRGELPAYPLGQGTRRVWRSRQEIKRIAIKAVASSQYGHETLARRIQKADFCTAANAARGNGLSNGARMANDR